jgi:hypothetical protein
VHLLTRADNRINRTSLNTQSAAYAKLFTDDSNRTFAFFAIRRV